MSKQEQKTAWVYDAVGLYEVLHRCAVRSRTPEDTSTHVKVMGDAIFFAIADSIGFENARRVCEDLGREFLRNADD